MTETWDKARKAGALESMLMIRRFEETIVRLFEEEAFMAHYHLYIGQEATGVGVMEALGPVVAADADEFRAAYTAVFA